MLSNEYVSSDRLDAKSISRNACHNDQSNIPMSTSYQHKSYTFHVPYILYGPNKLNSRRTSAVCSCDSNHSRYYASDDVFTIRIYPLLCSFFGLLYSSFIVITIKHIILPLYAYAPVKIFDSTISSSFARRIYGSTNAYGYIRISNPRSNNTIRHRNTHVLIYRKSKISIFKSTLAAGLA